MIERFEVKRDVLDLTSLKKLTIRFWRRVQVPRRLLRKRCHRQIRRNLSRLGALTQHCRISPSTDEHGGVYAFRFS